MNKVLDVELSGKDIVSVTFEINGVEYKVSKDKGHDQLTQQLKDANQEIENLIYLAKINGLDFSVDEYKEKYGLTKAN